MANLKSVQAAGAALYPIPSANGAAETVPIFGDFTLPSGLASGDIIEMVPLPAGYVLVDAIVDCESLGAPFTADVGLLSGNWGDSGVRTMGSEISTGKAFGTAGIYRADKAGFSRIAPTTNNRSIGIKGTTITTPVVGAKVRLTAFVRPQVEGV